MLTVPIPILNLFMLAVAAVVFTYAGLRHAPLPVQTGIVGAAIATAVAFGIGVVLWKRESPATVWPLPVILWIAITGGAAAWGYRDQALLHAQPLHVLETALIAAAACGLVALLIRAYDTHRPGVSKVAMVMAPLFFLLGIAHFFFSDKAHRGAISFWIHEFELLSAALTISWALFFITGIASGLLGIGAVREIPAGRDRDIAARSRWTAHLLLSLPAFVFVTVSLALWALICYAALQILPAISYQPLLRNQTRMLDQFIRQILSGPVEQALPVVLVLAGIAVLPAIWSLGPVVWREVFPPDPEQALRTTDSARLGAWLTRAYFGLGISGAILYVAMMFIMPIMVAVCALQADSVALPAGITKLLNAKWLGALGLVSGAGFAWIFAMRGSLKKLALGFRPALNIVLDIDNWLREHPLDSNPKARICGRYVSLLRYICNWRDPVTGQRYGKIVILAHSQGTVVSADLLRFIHTEACGSLATYDPELARLDELPVYFFTMGCPLRQLYGLRFPFLYAWARHQDDQPMIKWVKGDLPDTRHPDPSQLGVMFWVNAYRSGDYIGRNLWRTDSCAYIWTGDCETALLADPTPYHSTDRRMRLEYCIGAGAHTHYWDRTAPMIARELDRLIAR